MISASLGAESTRSCAASRRRRVGDGWAAAGGAPAAAVASRSTPERFPGASSSKRHSGPGAGSAASSPSPSRAPCFLLSSGRRPMGRPGRCHTPRVAVHRHVHDRSGRGRDVRQRPSSGTPAASSRVWSGAELHDHLNPCSIRPLAGERSHRRDEAEVTTLARSRSRVLPAFAAPATAPSTTPRATDATCPSAVRPLPFDIGTGAGPAQHAPGPKVVGTGAQGRSTRPPAGPASRVDGSSRSSIPPAAASPITRRLTYRPAGSCRCLASSFPAGPRRALIVGISASSAGPSTAELDADLGR